jgi:hypothetical protein
MRSVSSSDPRSNRSAFQVRNKKERKKSKNIKLKKRNIKAKKDKHKSNKREI